MKLLSVVGARPQFVKAAAVSRVLRGRYREVLVHTGQHYDHNMSDIFFEELEIPKPDYNLGVGSGSHAVQTAGILVGMEEVLLTEKPDCLLVYGDTNSTLAAALAAGKLLIPVAHVEAGLRSFNMRMPEEQNRILTDRLSALLFCPTDTAVENLRREGMEAGVHMVGDVMCDAVLYYAKQMEKQDGTYYFSRLTGLFGPVARAESWYLATIHRAENTDSPEKLVAILGALEQLDAPVLFPVHPRIRKAVEALHRENGYGNIRFTEPIGYRDMLYFTKNARQVVTDSGGLQKEAYILRTPAVTVRDQTEWKETLKGGWNILSKPVSEEILRCVNRPAPLDGSHGEYYGDGHAAEKICRVLGEWA